MGTCACIQGLFPEKGTNKRAEREAREELLALRGAVAGYQESTSRKDLLDEAGFIVDEKNPLIYVPEGEEKKNGIEHVVVYKKVAIRKRPCSDSHVLGACEQGQSLQLFEADETGNWRKLHFRLRGGYGSLVEAWVMLRHPSLGMLLRPANEKAEMSEPEPRPQAQEPAAESWLGKRAFDRPVTQLLHLPHGRLGQGQTW
ncbi:unnamed protein product [Effrenium voratum]|nr:unnamed protein product [Effrenium voratum]